ncbi:MAG: T9SS type A sorting domain-containing protein [bacterium]|nr:T9SS type A sorting domain-containing protein [bacterium]
MKKVPGFAIVISLFISILSYQNPLYSQEYLQKAHKNKDVSFHDLQRSFYEWSHTKDLSKTKGWKFYKRWDDFNTKRASKEGNLPDPEIYYNEVKKITSQKENLKNDNYNWAPVGLFNEANVYEGDMTGIGRINCMAFHPTDPNTFWVGVAQGGVWKTTNHGKSWVPLTDDLPMLRISDICVDENDPDIMYISVGDYAYVGIGLNLDHRKRHSHYGIGIFKTTDGGQTWNPTGLSFEQTEYDGSLIRRIFIDENDSETILAAGTQGIWKSEDGGDNWIQKREDLIWDFERDPINQNIVYASKGYIYTLREGECGILKSSDFGETWVEHTIDIPPVNEVERLEIAISPSDPNYIYVSACDINGAFYGIYASTDGGLNWELKSNTPNIFDWEDGSSKSGMASYAQAIIVDPNDKNKIYAGCVSLWGSADGGSTWDGVSYWQSDYGPSIHADQHFLAYNQLDNKFYVCNDGGLYSTDQIEIGSWSDAIIQTNYKWPTTWTSLNNGLVVTSFYRMGLSKNNNNFIVAGAQDNSTYYFNSENWYNIFGGDGMECIIHPENPSIIYCSYQRGNLAKSIDGGKTFNYITYGKINEEGEWITPYVMHPRDNNVLFAGYGNLWKTLNGGLSWSKISNFPNIYALQQPGQITSVAVSDINPSVIYISKRPYHFYNELGSVWITTNGGDTWENITANLPNELYITYMAVDDENPSTAWVTCSGFEEGLKVYKTINSGESWVNISRNLPNLPANCIVEHKGKQHNPIYIGMDVGVYYTNDTLNQWILLNDQLPNVIISELEIHEASNKLYAATFGRGIWNVDLYENTDNPENNIYNSDMETYPNPSNGTFELVLYNFQSENASLKVLDITGKTVYSSTITSESPEFQKSISLNVDAGLYYVVIYDEKHSKVRKIIID